MQKKCNYVITKENITDNNLSISCVIAGYFFFLKKKYTPYVKNHVFDFFYDLHQEVFFLQKKKMFLLKGKK